MQYFFPSDHYETSKYQNRPHKSFPKIIGLIGHFFQFLVSSERYYLLQLLLITLYEEKKPGKGRSARRSSELSAVARCADSSAPAWINLPKNQQDITDVTWTTSLGWRARRTTARTPSWVRPKCLASPTLNLQLKSRKCRQLMAMDLAWSVTS